ncbi:MAG: hypothetical protein ACKVUS_15110 [Saprospiraceae bacterium]
MEIFEKRAKVVRPAKIAFQIFGSLARYRSTILAATFPHFKTAGQPATDKA